MRSLVSNISIFHFFIRLRRISDNLTIQRLLNFVKLKLKEFRKTYQRTLNSLKERGYAER
jgi:hypothetical protein